MRIATFLAVVVAFFVAAVAPLGRSPAARDEARRAAAASALGIADLCLSSDARWLRHPSLSEPGAAFQDLAGGLDAYPAGMVLAPPASAWADCAGGGARIRAR